MLALAEYFPKATVWAADIDSSRCRKAVFEHPRVRFLKGDAYAPDFTAKLGKTQFDLIIDDASHEVDDQVRLLKALIPFLKAGGFYVVEDCCTGHWLPRLPGLRALGLRQTLIDMSTDGTYDNTLIRFDPVPSVN